MTTPSLYNVNEEDNSKESINSDRKESAHTDINDNPADTEADTNSHKESDKLPKPKGFYKANLLTVITALIVVTITVIVQIPLELALPIWLSAFIADVIYTYKNRKLIGYELNYLVRYSKALYNTLLVGFLLVFIIEVILLLILSVTMSMFSDLPSTFAVFCIFFATLHISAFIRSYIFVKKRNKIMDSKDSDNDNN